MSPVIKKCFSFPPHQLQFCPRFCAWRKTERREGPNRGGKIANVVCRLKILEDPSMGYEKESRVLGEDEVAGKKDRGG